MSGPIIRKYGFPNFDQIFGKKELQHGVDEVPPTDEKQEGGKPDSSAAADPQQTSKPEKPST